MKNIILITSLVLTFTSCSSSSTPTENKSETTTTNQDEKYFCPMHPEEVGNKGDECSKCGMELTELVK